MAAVRTSLNFGAFVGQGSIRSAVMGNVNREATDAELTRMKELVRQGMNDGAFGLGSGLFNGQIVFDGSAMTAARPGRVLRGPAHAGG